MRVATWTLVIAALAAVPGTAVAQTDTSSGIAGVVKDATGGVLPGVTVEAASPALIEKVRTVVTDGDGNYKLVDLRPATYTVTFTLPGFSTVKREGIQLNSGFTATVNTELKVGDVSETIVVTGASPVVDVQNTRTQSVLSAELLTAAPAGRMNPHAFVAMTVGVRGFGTQDVGGSTGETGAGTMSYHGINSTDSKLKYDGMDYNHLGQDGGGSSRWFRPNSLAVTEANLGLGGHTAESETAGVQQNLVPKDGSNRLSLLASGVYANDRFASANLSDEIRARGLNQSAAVVLAYDAGVAIGGPIREDKLWFFVSPRWWTNKNRLPGGFFNATPHTPFFTPDLSRPAFQIYPEKIISGRLTWQATEKHKFTFDHHRNRGCQCGGGSPSAAGTDGGFNVKPRLTQATWSMPATNRLLIQAGMAYVDQVQWQSASSDIESTDVGIQDTGLGITYGSPAGGNFPVQGGLTPGVNSSKPFVLRGSMAYVTGSHAFKVGMNTVDGVHDFGAYINQSRSYRFLNGRPTTVVQYASPFFTSVRIQSRGLYAQDQWTVDRLTLNLGVRFDHFKSRVLAETLPAGDFVPERSFEALDNVPNYKDISPRLGAAYDLFGNGKTAIKGYFGRYVSSMGAGFGQLNSPAVRAVHNVTRGWTDANGNYVPDCVLVNLNLNGECGAVSNRLFGTAIAGTRYSDHLLRGWFKRPYTWQGSVSLQQELRPGLSATAAYFHNSYGNFEITHNEAVTAADFTRYCVTAPIDSRLPGGGGHQICGLYDVVPTKFAQINNLVGRPSEFGIDNLTRVYNSVDVTMMGRIGKGQLSGGVNIGRTVTDDCALNDSPHLTAGGQAFGNTDGANAAGFVPGGGNHPRSTPYCHVATPWSQSAEVKITGSHPLPAGFEFGAVFQNRPNISADANLTYTNAQVAPVLGRNLAAGTAGTVTVPLVAPYTLFEDRLSQLDLRVSRNFSVGTARLRAILDVYNALNAAAVTSVNGTFGSRWLNANTIMIARYFKIGGQLEF